MILVLQDLDVCDPGVIQNRHWIGCVTQAISAKDWDGLNELVEYARCWLDVSQQKEAWIAKIQAQADRCPETAKESLLVLLRQLEDPARPGLRQPRRSTFFDPHKIEMWRQG